VGEAERRREQHQQVRADVAPGTRTEGCGPERLRAAPTPRPRLNCDVGHSSGGAHLTIEVRRRSPDQEVVPRMAVGKARREAGWGSPESARDVCASPPSEPNLTQDGVRRLPPAWRTPSAQHAGPGSTWCSVTAAPGAAPAASAGQETG